MVWPLLVGAGLSLLSGGAQMLAQEEQRKRQARLAAKSSFSMTPRVSSSAPPQPQTSTQMPRTPVPEAAQVPMPPGGSRAYDAYQPSGPVMTGAGGVYRSPQEPPPGAGVMGPSLPSEGYQPQGYRESLAEEPVPGKAGYRESLGSEQTPEQASAASAGGVPWYLQALVGAGGLGLAAYAGSQAGRGSQPMQPGPGGMRELPGGGSPEQFGARQRALRNYLDYYRMQNRGGGLGYGV